MSIFEYDKEEEEAKLRKAEYAAGQERGEQIGQERGENKFAELAVKLVTAKRLEELQKAKEDIQYREGLYKEYNL